MSLWGCKTQNEFTTHSGNRPWGKGNAVSSVCVCGTFVRVMNTKTVQYSNAASMWVVPEVKTCMMRRGGHLILADPHLRQFHLRLGKLLADKFPQLIARCSRINRLFRQQKQYMVRFKKNKSGWTNTADWVHQITTVQYEFFQPTVMYTTKTLREKNKSTVTTKALG